MSTTEMTVSDSPHGATTRFVHAGLAISIIVQLATSLAMRAPNVTFAGDTLFQIHRLSGFAATAFALLFWMTALVRQRGTSLGALFPWLSAQRRAAFFADLLAHLRAAARLRLPTYREDGAFASGIHGLGLLLVSAMAISGTAYAIQVATGQHSAEPDGTLAMAVHVTLANLVWAYLIGHAAMAFLHHISRSARLGRMWSFSR